MIAAVQAHLSKMQMIAVEATSLGLALENVLGYPDHIDVAVSLTSKITNLTDSMNDGLDVSKIGHVIAAATETPVMRLYRQIKTLYDDLNAYVHDPKDGPEDEIVQRLFVDKRNRLESEMHSTPSQTPQDMAAKMVVGHVFGDLTCLGWDGPEWAEARALVGV